MKAIYDEDPQLPKPETIDRNEGVGTMPENSENKKPIIPEVLKRDCPHLSGLQRGEQLRILIAQGCSKRGLARELGCSPALIRQLIELSEASSDEKEALSSGKRGRKKTLELARGRKAEQKLRRLIDDEERKERLIAQYQQLISGFVQARVAPCDRERFFSELHFWVNILRAGKSDHASPMEQAPTELPADAWAVIDQYKPRGREPEHVPERINFDLQWLLRFLPRVIPRGEIMDAAFNRAEYNLLRGGPPAPPSNQRHENRCWSVSEAALEEVNLLVVLGSAGYLVGKTLLAKYRRILETQENCEA